MATAELKRRRLDFRDFDDLLADVNHLHAVGYQKVKLWDLSQMLDHIRTGMKTAMKGSPNQAPWIVRMIAALILKRVLKTRRMKEGIKVPKWVLPGPGRDETQAVADFHKTLDEFRNFKGPTKPHPFFGPLDYAKWKELNLIHAAHHLSFLIPKS